MSVILFGAEELGNVAAYLARGPFEADGDLERLCRQLAAYSVGNAAAYAYRYNEEAEPVAFEEILAGAFAAQDDRAVDAKRAVGTIQLLSYNGPEGEGLEKYKGRPAYLKAMVALLNAAYGKLARQLEPVPASQGVRR